MFNFPRPESSQSRQPFSSRSAADSAEFVELQAEVERLYFITEALWRILKEKHGLDDNELVKQITLIDIEDGKLDGRKPKAPPQPCPKCNRTVGRQRMKCLFCGEPIAQNPFDR
ncbi:MAG: hypothetical protein RL088_1462 [Verrucomicrobiota bacterium]|jgi:hypothetical protein